jgi:hypothetical protein
MSVAQPYPTSKITIFALLVPVLFRRLLRRRPLSIINEYIENQKRPD